MQSLVKVIWTLCKSSATFIRPSSAVRNNFKLDSRHLVFPTLQHIRIQMKNQRNRCFLFVWPREKSQQGPLRRIWSLGALGEGSGWDLRVRPSAAAAAESASGNVGTWKSWNLVWNGSIWLDMAWYYRQIDRTDVAHLFCFQEIIKNWPRVQTRGPDASSFSSLKN